MTKVHQYTNDISLADDFGDTYGSTYGKRFSGNSGSATTTNISSSPRNKGSVATAITRNAQNRFSSIVSGEVTTPVNYNSSSNVLEHFVSESALHTERQHELIMQQANSRYEIDLVNAKKDQKLYDVKNEVELAKKDVELTMMYRTAAAAIVFAIFYCVYK